MRRLRRRHRVVLETLLPRGAHPALPKGLYDTGFDDFYDDFRQRGAGRLRFAFHLTLFLSVWVAPLLIGRVPPITLYSSLTRERALQRLFESRFFLFRQLGLTTKLVVALCYGADRDVRDAVGYPMQHDDPRRQEPIE